MTEAEVSIIPLKSDRPPGSDALEAASMGLRRGSGLNVCHVCKSSKGDISALKDYCTGKNPNDKNSLRLKTHLRFQYFLQTKKKMKESKREAFIRSGVKTKCCR